MPPDVRSTAELFVTVKVTGRVMPGSAMMHPDTLLDCKERVKTVTEFGSVLRRLPRVRMYLAADCSH